jgi:predicted O-linked N-acetylglucosamine transferase (SPINDLY family)
MGIPSVTLSGATAASRGGASLLTNLQLTELIAHTQDQYINIAASLAADLPILSHLRSTLRQRMQDSVLMDGKRFARDLESIYRTIWTDWCAHK